MIREFIIFISSVHKGLRDYRRCLGSALNKTPSLSDYAIRTVMTENGGPSSSPPLRTCLDRVNNADAVMFIVSFRYGSLIIDDESQRSYTEAEFDEALRLGKPVFVFMAESTDAFERSEIDNEPDRIRVFREKILAAQSGHFMMQKFFDFEHFEELARETVTTSLPELICKTQADISLPDKIADPFDGMNEQILYGRDKDLDELDAWVRDAEYNGLIIEAIGGMGKSSLAWEWFTKLSERLGKPNSQTQIAGKLWWSCYMRGRTLAALGQFFRKWIESAIPESSRICEEDDWKALQDYLCLLKSPPLVVIDGLEAEFVGYEGRRRGSSYFAQKSRKSISAKGDFTNATESNRIDPEETFSFFIDTDAGEGLLSLIRGGLVKVLITTRHTPDAFKDARNPKTHLKGSLYKKCLDLLDVKNAILVLNHFNVQGSEQCYERLLIAEQLRHPLVLTGFAGSVLEDPLADGNLDYFIENNPDFDLSTTLRRDGRRFDILTFILKNLTEIEQSLADFISTSDRPLPATFIIEQTEKQTEASPQTIKKALVNLEKRRNLIYSSPELNKGEQGQNGRSYSMHPVYRMHNKRYRLDEVQKMAAAARTDYEKELFQGVGRYTMPVDREHLDKYVVPGIEYSVTAKDYTNAWGHFNYLLKAKDKFGLYRLAYNYLLDLVVFHEKDDELINIDALVTDSDSALSILGHVGDLARLFGDTDISCACYNAREALIKENSKGPDQVELIKNAMSFFLAERKRLSSSEIAFRINQQLESIKKCEDAEKLWGQFIYCITLNKDMVDINEHARLCGLSAFTTLINWCNLDESLLGWHLDTCAYYRERAGAHMQKEFYCSRAYGFLRNFRSRFLLRAMELDSYMHNELSESAKTAIEDFIIQNRDWNELDLSYFPEYFQLALKIAEIKKSGLKQMDDANRIEQWCDKILRKYRKRWGPNFLCAFKYRKLQFFITTDQKEKAADIFQEVMEDIKTLELSKANWLFDAIGKYASELNLKKEWDDLAAQLPEAYKIEALESDPIYGFEVKTEDLPPLSWY